MWNFRSYIIAFALAMQCSAAIAQPARTPIDSELRTTKIQRKLVASGALQAEVGTASDIQLIEALAKFRTAIGSAETGKLTESENARLDAYEKALDGFAGFEEFEDPFTKLKIKLPTKLVNKTATPSSTKSEAYYEFGAEPRLIVFFRYNARQYTPIALATRLLERRNKIVYDNLDLRADGFNIDATFEQAAVTPSACGTADSQRRAIFHTRGWDRSGDVMGIQARFGLSPPCTEDVPRMIVTPRAIAAGAEAAAINPVDAASENWNAVTKAVIRLMTADFERLNGWETISSKECSTSRTQLTRSSSVREQKLIEIFYATDRLPKEGATKLSPPEADKLFSSSPDDNLHFGCIVVSVPPTAQKAELLTDLIARGPAGTKDADKNKHFFVERFAPKGQIRQGEPRDIALEVAGSRKHFDRALLFIHGYNNSFADALLRVAQIAAAIEYPGRIYLFSWPSQESMYGYIGDMDYAERADISLQYFMRLILRDSNITDLDIIAHSMGSQILLRSIDGLRPAFDRRLGPKKEDKLRLGQVIFAAPDVSALVFQKKVGTLQALAKRITVYVSANDGALGISQVLRSWVPRAGGLDDDGQPIHVANVEVVDISGQALPVWDPRRYLGSYHVSFAYEEAVRNDMKALLNSAGGSRVPPLPNERGRFEARPYKNPEFGNYWVLVPEPKK